MDLHEACTTGQENPFGPLGIAAVVVVEVVVDDARLQDGVERVAPEEVVVDVEGVEGIMRAHCWDMVVMK